MGSESLKLPVIELSNLKHESETWESTKVQVRQALEDYGCFEATFDQIPVDLRESVLDGLKQLFDLPLEVKLCNKSERPYHGYTGQVPTLPLYESLGIEDVASPHQIHSFTNLMWPQGNPSFSKSVQSYIEKLWELDKIVRKVVLESCGVGKHVEDHMRSTNYVVRVQKYDSPPNHETQPGLLPHLDLNILTILQQLNHVAGLEILTKHANKWITARPSSPYSFFVFAGISFHAWTNGRLHSPLHRVTMNGDEARYSIGLFSVPKPGSLIKAPDELVDEDHPLLYKPFDHHKFIEFLNSQAVATSSDALKNYCGA
ncbi:probable 2-oxoglutarate-dependent dioxygenase AOP1 isoform X2 [Salvia miltiorrhiza]|uniref:probable 2-oxoglutarate-dependent dioxygenase AOP1 isoform X2 n=1 Tax=Salvia miltiorrhiza TaxID=226208 RepID=UPI0025ACB880|nr:probable 2-oxoglutarate-dependent dioxygenase AOP1 isoform X2 [Salvia miltiorrhiza]